MTSLPLRSSGVKGPTYNVKQRSETMGFGKDGKGQLLREVDSFDVGSIPAQGMQKNTSLTATIERGFRILKSKGTATITAVDTGAGAIIMYLASNAMTEAEALQAIRGGASAGTDKAFPLSTNQVPEKEYAERRMWKLGVFNSESTDIQSFFDWDVDIRWTFQEGTGWAYFLYNTENVAKVGANWGSVDLVAEQYGVWVG